MGHQGSHHTNADIKWDGSVGIRTFRVKPERRVRPDRRVTPERRGTHVRIFHYNPTRRRLRILLSIVLVLTFGWGTYTLGLRLSGKQWELANRELDDLRGQVVQLEDQRTDLLQKLARSEQATDVELQASKTVTQNLARLEARIMELNEELSFYKGIISPSQTKRGLFIQKFRVSAGEETRKYNYKLVLTQVRSNNKLARGKVKLRIAGKRGGKQVTLSLSELSGQGKDTLSFSFKYFQSFEGDLVLPVGFSPSNFNITVTPQTRKLDKIQKSYAWSEALSGGI